ncbi:pyroglutamyl peptidase type [Drepanopeziza brunnea f. sp. 'multigermtubi' MB_m1]|uniref:Pyroglutamyl peptidase type n=1 Tax=Marssonina brunnea f. sp. multigermtubi (strain MB_m1) TaxID=1072389 RepID=K1XIR6_MARBU|nr:pyroglutamyl peptidase type [Drepanopeziza brunnea f. sp. 'multigermtubi' MB_m1]EKD20593.1 pyroglutamyl peptidase type [Drepanopeziza brunnea f. sp. 'multigermtubi' MB_m1]
MGSLAEGSASQEEEITVLVTGFGPFRAQNPINPSWEIAKGLPPFLPPSEFPPLEVSAIAKAVPVRILVHPAPVKVAYKSVRELVPALWDGRKIDYAIHIGMASGRKFYSVERRGHRDGYTIKDVDHELLGDEERRKREGDGWVWNGMPEELLSSIDVDDVWKRWRAALPGTDVRVSEDAGRYLCDFIYFSSLAHLARKGEDRRVVFLHVPVAADELAIENGIEITLELIRAIVQSGRMKQVLARRRSSLEDGE